MRDSWATLGVDLHLDSAAAGSGRGVRAGLTHALREAVRGGRLSPGTRLPSSRTLAADLGIARNTVADAYADLVAEGWLTARQGSGTRVATRTAPRTEPSSARPGRVPAGPAHDLRPGSPDLASFPRAAWLKAARRAVTHAPNDAFGHADPRGRPELRAAVAEYSARTRGVHAEPERVIICAGFAQGLRLLGTVLAAGGGREAAVEAYGLDFHREILSGTGLRTHPLPFDALGTDPRGLTRGQNAPAAVLLTAAHQFPMGLPLHHERRATVVDWARSGGGLIIEDDYDGEFRYDRQPVGALQGLAPDRVAYLGTASKALAPALRLGWMILPRGLADEVAAAKGWADRAPGALEQLTLAEFITSGAYDRHVRSMRLRYRRRRDQLVRTLADRAPDVRVTGIAAGLHAVLELPEGTEAAVLRAAAWQQLAVEGLSAFRHPQAPPYGPDAIVVGYGTPADHGWTGALEALCRALA
ncbi:MocR-like pyridoxine biosynthesis transcription factor PdxR [Streptomyces tsukubensis]|uniref:GntR family transcriptional regulator n=1 Tax=Streptomyces tsukubensis TaxID=83656 RepID=A0A1V4A352_9ACTN|nr:PLP-dependent aminotransferase family protein [Streptomyces tsukubensis]OON74416.1 GntR family transcriptional regulator [Streptomyces tsukubensis]QFR95344.1 aminotransferase class I/II-fold pyridoxal phosphate-dependent enzyme [Streptomyces tsukubensis]